MRLMKKVSVILAVLFLAIAFYFANKKNTAMIRVGGKEISVEIAKTEEEREKGLSERQSLCEDCGLLFVFDSMDIYPFWMRKMYFDIDIIWIVGDKVVDITEGAKKPSLADLDKPSELYFSRVEIDRVLEVNAGFVKKNKIFIGDKIEY